MSQLQDTVPALSAPPLTAWTIGFDGNGTAAVTPPTGNEFVLGDRGLTQPAMASLGDSDFLWISSLTYLPYVHEENQSAIVETTAASCWALLSAADGRSRIRTSQDHLVALRLYAVAYLLERDVPVPELLCIFESDLKWALTPRNVATNNHGLMLCLALLDVLPVIADSVHRSRVQTYASENILKILDSVLGEDGFCDENSPFYAHLYNIKVREVLNRHSGPLSDTGTISEVRAHLERCSNALRQVTYEDGCIPAIGDSSENSSPYVGVPGTYSSPRTGFWIHKTDSLYVSMRAGSSSSIHRHADDLSLIVRYRGSEFISDSGFHSFNYSDPRVRMVRSQRGHSGLYFPKYDELINGELFGRNRISSSMTDGTSNGIARVRGCYTIDQQHSAYRALEISATSIKIDDTYHSVSGLDAVQRFIVPEEVDIVVSQNRVTLSRDGVALLITAEYPCRIDIVSGETAAPFKGWRSPSPRALVKAHCVEISPLDSRISSLPVRLAVLDTAARAGEMR